MNKDNATTTKLLHRVDICLYHFTKLCICVTLLKKDEYLKKIKLVQLGLFKLEGVPHTSMEIHIIFK